PSAALPATLSTRTPRLPIGPHSQLVPARIAEVESAAAGERVGRSDDLPARALDLRLDVFQTGGVDHHEWIGGPDGRVLREAAAQAAILEARVVGPVILEPPAEHLLIELPGPADVGRPELDVVNLPVMLALRHRAPFGTRV